MDYLCQKKCIYANVVLQDQIMLREFVKCVLANAKMLGFTLYIDVKKQQAIDEEIIVDSFEKDRFCEMYMVQDFFFIQLRLESWGIIKLFPITENNCIDDLAPYVNVLLYLSDNFKLCEFNTLGIALNEEYGY